MEEITLDRIIATLDAAGRYNTRPRRAVVEQILRFAEADRDFTIETLWNTVREHEATVGRATAFRTIETLVEHGIIDRVSFADGSERYHLVQPGEHHHHLTCERCHRVVAISLCLTPDQLDTMAHSTGFALSGHRIEIFGVCRDCQSAR